ncbi:MAG: cation diffusion facilitator family transporter [Porphyromonadaceae bacterium]|nr:cation diffusion facilitator family transporter [Porphyromonadaceae bacterium]
MPSCSNDRSRCIIRVSLLGTVCNALLALAKFWAGVYGNSTALVADAVNSLSDFITDIILLVFVRISGKPQDHDHRYGHGKYETLATAIVAIMMIIAGSLLLFDSLETLWGIYRGEVQLEAPTYLTLAIAVGSLITKDLLCRYTITQAKALGSSVLHAKALDHRGDTYMLIGVALGILCALLFGAGWEILDPIAASVVSFFIMRMGIMLILPAFNELMDGSLPINIINEIEDLIFVIPEIRGIRNLHTRSVGSRYAIELDVLLDGEMSVAQAHDITDQVEATLRNRYGSATHVVVHVEPFRRSIH